VEKRYQDDQRFIEFKQQMNQMRRKYIQTDIAASVPPKGRKKSEYQSFDKIEQQLELLPNTKIV